MRACWPRQPRWPNGSGTSSPTAPLDGPPLNALLSPSTASTYPRRSGREAPTDRQASKQATRDPVVPSACRCVVASTVVDDVRRLEDALHPEVTQILIIRNAGLSSLSFHPSHLIHIVPSSLIPSHLSSHLVFPPSLLPLPTSALVASSIIDAYKGLLEWVKEQLQHAHHLGRCSRPRPGRHWLPRAALRACSSSP